MEPELRTIEHSIRDAHVNLDQIESILEGLRDGLLGSDPAQSLGAPAAWPPLVENADRIASRTANLVNLADRIRSLVLTSNVVGIADVATGSARARG